MVLRGVVDPALCASIVEEVQAALAPLVGPAEFEADLGYPGAPSDRAQPGGETPRRLLHAYARSTTLRQLALAPAVTTPIKKFLRTEASAQPDATLCLSQAHHNCVMTKFPGFSSATLWHQDIRYWSFDQPQLISAWFALAEEHSANGGLQLIPGSHRLSLGRGRLDRDLFLRPELPENARLIESAQAVHLQAGDVLLFHCRTFHAAGRNNTNSIKLSPVFTYHLAQNRPIPGTRSAGYPPIDVSIDG